MKYASVLRYLVEVRGLYSHPSVTRIAEDGLPRGFHTGQEVWAEAHLQFRYFNEARDWALKVSGKVIKIRVSARTEPLSGSRKHRVTTHVMEAMLEEPAQEQQDKETS